MYCNLVHSMLVLLLRLNFCGFCALEENLKSFTTKDVYLFNNINHQCIPSQINVKIFL